MLNKRDELEQKLIRADSDEAIISDALRAYDEGDDKKFGEIIDGLPGDLRTEILSDREMIEFFREMANDEAD